MNDEALLEIIKHKISELHPTGYVKDNGISINDAMIDITKKILISIDEEYSVIEMSYSFISDSLFIEITDNNGWRQGCIITNEPPRPQAALIQLDHRFIWTVHRLISLVPESIRIKRKLRTILNK